MQDNKEVLKKILASKIQELRKAKGKSINLLSNEINLSKSIWSDLEKGLKDPQFSTLWRIAEALEIPLSEIITQLEQDFKASFIEE